MMTARCCWSAGLLLLNLLSRFFLMCSISFFPFVETRFESVASPWSFWSVASLHVPYGVSGRLIDSTSEDPSLTDVFRTRTWAALGEFKDLGSPAVTSRTSKSGVSRPFSRLAVAGHPPQISLQTAKKVAKVLKNPIFLPESTAFFVLLPYVLYFSCYSFLCE